MTRMTAVAAVADWFATGAALMLATTVALRAAGEA